MSIAQGDQRLVFTTKIREIGHNVEQGLFDQGQGLFLQEQIGIAANKLGGGAQMNNRFGGGALLAVSINMGHDIVAYFLFFLGGQLKVDISGMSFKLSDHLLGNQIVQAQFMLSLSQGDPAAPPGGELAVFGKNSLHFRAGISAYQRFLINFTIHSVSPL